MVKPITTNGYTIKDLFSFAKEVEELDPNIAMASFNVISIVKVIPLIKTIGICVENLCRNQTSIDSLQKVLFVGY